MWVINNWHGLRGDPAEVSSCWACACSHMPRTVVRLSLPALFIRWLLAHVQQRRDPHSENVCITLTGGCGGKRSQ